MLHAVLMFQLLPQCTSYCLPSAGRLKQTSLNGQADISSKNKNREGLMSQAG